MVMVGWGYGCEGLDCSQTSWVQQSNTGNERSVVWVTPTEAATIYVDFDGNGVSDKTINAGKLESVVIRDDVNNDNDMSGAIIWAVQHNQPASSSQAVSIVSLKCSISSSLFDWFL